VLDLAHEAQFEEMAAASAKAILDAAAQKAKVAGVESLRSLKKSCDLIVMASHGRRTLERL
jgi:hypothetical protein